MKDQGIPRWLKIAAIIGAIAVLLVIVMMTLGGGHKIPDHSSPIQDAATPTATTSGAPTGAGAPANGADATRTIDLAADASGFNPPTIGAAAGEVVTFRVTNEDGVDHEFVLGDESAQQQRAEMRRHASSAQAHDWPNAVLLKPGETKVMTWRFGSESITYACHEPGHYDAGMHGTVTVE